MLTPSQLNEPFNRRQIAKSIADLHKVQLPELDKTPCFLKTLEEKDLIKMVQEKVAKTDYTPIETDVLNEILSLLDEKEISFLKGILPTSAESVVFSHNDLHAQNVLVLKKNQKLLLIDYEYSNYNYRGYDIANFFNESVFDYNSDVHPYYLSDETKFPSDDEMREFIQYYLLFFKFNLKSSEVDAILKDQDVLNQYIQKYYNYDAFIEEVEGIFGEVKVCLLLSHYYWILWSVLMYKANAVKFDYLNFACKRFQMYQNLKRKFYRRKLHITKTLSQQSL